MNWLAFALLSPALYTGVVFIDKYVVERRVPDYRGMPIFTALSGFLFGTLLWGFGGFPVLNATDTVLILLSGMLTAWASALYFKTLLDGETSSIIVLYQMTPVFVITMSFVLLNETIDVRQLAGFGLIIFSVTGVSLRKEESSAFRLSKTFLLVMLIDLMWASAAVLFKFLTRTNSFSDLIGYEGWGLGLGGTLLYLAFPSFRRAFHTSVAAIHRSTWGIIFFNEGLFVLAKLVNYLAISLGPVALVSVLGGTEVFYGILLGWLLTTIAPTVFAEDIRTRNLLKKSGFAAVLLVGIWLVG